MTEAELRSLPKVRIPDVVRYLQGEFNAQHLRELAKAGRCPFILAVRGTGKWSYHINVGLLIRYKAGELGLMVERGVSA